MSRHEYPDSTCVWDPDSDTSVDVPPKPGDDTPVHVFVMFLQKSHGYGEESPLPVVRDEVSVTLSVPRRFHHDGAEFVRLSFAPVLCVVTVPLVVPAGDRDGPSQRCSYLLWSRQLKGVRCLLRKPEETQDRSCKRQRFTRHVFVQVSLARQVLYCFLFF